MELCQGVNCKKRDSCLHYIEYINEFNNETKFPLKGGGPWAPHELCRVFNNYVPAYIRFESAISLPGAIGS